MLQRDVRQQRRLAAEGVHAQVHAGEHEAALIGLLGGDIGDGGGGTHLHHDDGGWILLKGRHGAGYDVGAQLVVNLHADVEARFHAGAHHHGRLAGKAGQRLFHGEIHTRHHAGKNRAGNGMDIHPIQGKDVHQVNADLIRRLAAVGVQGGEKHNLLVVIQHTHGNGGVADINGQQHTHTSRKYYFVCIISRGSVFRKSQVAQIAVNAIRFTG